MVKKSIVIAIFVLLPILWLSSQEADRLFITHYIESNMTPSQDVSLFRFKMKITWEVVDCIEFLKKYSGLEYYKKIIENDAKIALLKIIPNYSSDFIKEIIPNEPKKEKDAVYNELMEKIKIEMEYVDGNRKEESIVIKELEIIRLR